MGYWYNELPHEGISSLLQLVKEFGKECDPNIDEETMYVTISLPKKVHLKEILEDHFSPLDLSTTSNELLDMFMIEFVTSPQYATRKTIKRE